ncbi:MAG: SUMF1/EgtB/PvdO family nonheme iron enzyme [Magnetococcales bacterium]|nr:SUMF1/EgtB/PvdO family nonheme iron enzyme [Magnetococcales bacterium]
MNIKRRFGENRRNFQRTQGAIRKPVSAPTREVKRRNPLIAYKKPLALGAGALLLAGGVGLLITLFKPTPAVTLPWQACLTKWPDGTLYPDLFPVPTGEYQLSNIYQELKPFLAPHGLQKIAIKEPFLMEKREVSIKAFRRYVAFVDHMEQGAEKERLKSRIGLHWNRDDSETTSVKGISWEAAWDYTDWLGQQTGCAYTLPSREQWGAAAILLNGAQKSTDLARYVNEESLKMLLWGAREWTSSACAGGYYLVGEDDLVPLPEVRSATCMPAMLSVAGFRVAIKAAGNNQDNGSLKRHSTPARP